jgi:hypothetical protein
MMHAHERHAAWKHRSAGLVARQTTFGRARPVVVKTILAHFEKSRFVRNSRAGSCVALLSILTATLAPAELFPTPRRCAVLAFELASLANRVGRRK